MNEIAPSTMLWFIMIMNGPPEAIDCIHYKVIQEHGSAILDIAYDLELIDAWSMDYPDGRKHQYKNSWFIIRQAVRDRQWLGFEWKEVIDDTTTVNDDLRVIYQRYHLLKDEPLVKHGMFKFKTIDRTMGYKVRNFLWRLHSNVEKRKEWETDRTAFYNTVLEEIQKCMNAWEAIGSINQCNPICNAFSIRKHIMDLRPMFSKEEWESGDFPPIGPTWRFVEIPLVGCPLFFIYEYEDDTID